MALLNGHDRAFLEKCEQFLLHPTVRALSLAQRVDFLERKGLSPEEITSCLKNIQHQNGLTQVLKNSSELAVAGSSSAATSLGVITLMKNYGVVTLVTLFFGYGYLRFRQKMTEQLVLARALERMKRRGRKNTKVQEVLALISDQQKQYKQAALLLRDRVEKLEAAKKVAAAQELTTRSMSVTKNRELEALQTELLKLKTAVVDTYIRPPGQHNQNIATRAEVETDTQSVKVARAEKEEMHQAKPLQEAVSVESQTIEPEPRTKPAQCTVHVRESKTNTSAIIRTQKKENDIFTPAENTVKSAAAASWQKDSPLEYRWNADDIKEILSNYQECDELSTAIKYRLLLTS